MKYWYDTEFYEDGSTIDLISIGIVAEDGRELYRQNDEFDWRRVPAGHWIWDNVHPHLKKDYSGPDIVWGTRDEIAHDVQWFITAKGHDNELWGYYSAYDHVVLAQLFGRMVDMPEGIPWFTRDIKQEQERLDRMWFKHGLLLPEQTSTAHNALNDARWTRDAYYFLRHVENDNYGREVIDGWG